MKTCSICSVRLKFSNTPTFGSGKLNDGNIICTNCFKQISKINTSIALKLKKYSLSDINNILNEENSRLEEIKTQIKGLNIDNISSFFGRKEISELPEILAQEEKIDHIVQGTYNDGNGILVSTDRRLIFIDKGMLYGLKVEDFALDKISSIQYETGILFGKIKIHASGNIAEIKNVEKKYARVFSEFIRRKLSEPKRPLENTKEPDVIEQLEKLKKLKENGVITEEEFNEQKTKLLARL